MSNINSSSSKNDKKLIEIGEVYNSRLYISNTEMQKHIFLQFIPIAITTTIFAPIERTKTILQTIDLIAIKSSEKITSWRILFPKIIRDQGFFSIYRGNSASLLKHLFQCFGNILLYQQINFLLFKDKILVNQALNNSELFFSSAISSLINVTISYPFDLAHTRICGDMSRINFKRLNSSVLEVFSKCLQDESLSKKNSLDILKIYKGYSFGLISNYLYFTTSFYCFEKINKFVNKFSEKVNINNSYSSLTAKIYAMFGGSIITTLLASGVSYPFDTIKKKLQVNAAFGFQFRYSSGKELIVDNFRNFKGLYGGFSLHLIKCIPFGFVHYCILQKFGFKK